MRLTLRRRASGRFPRVDGNAVTILAGGEAFYEDLLAAIAAARHEVLLGTYLWADDATGQDFLVAAAAAARRGVRVAVFIDGVGSFSMGEAQLQALRDAGAQTAVYHPVRHAWSPQRLLRRNHRKNCSVDGAIAWTGGAGFADEWSARAAAPWWDVMVRVEGPAVAQFRHVFRRDWQRVTRQRLPETPGSGPEDGSPAPGVSAPGASAPGASAPGASAPGAAAPGAAAPGVVSPGAAAPPAGAEVLRALPSGLTRRELLRELLGAVQRSRERVWIASAYFVPAWWLRRRLRAAARRGVDVRVLVPGPRTDHRAVWFAGRRHYGKLLAAGVRIFEYRRGLMHAKYALVDDRWGCVGSSNLDAWSARYNLELDLECTSPGALADLGQRFEADVAGTREITHERWRARAWRLRLAETVFGWIDPVL